MTAPILCEQCDKREGIQFITMSHREVLVCDECRIDYLSALADQYDDHSPEEKQQ